MTDKKPIRTVKSFVHRQRTLTPNKQEIFTALWQKFGLEIKKEQLDLEKTFSNKNSIIIEIGFGMGETLLHMATTFPEINFIGIEIHMPGIFKTLNSIEKNNLKNVKIYNADAIDVLQHCIPNNAVDKFLIFFPDPWHKKRHHKRRLIQKPFLELVTSKLTVNGIVHIATDWQDYAEHVLEVVSQMPELTNLAEENKFSPRPNYRPLTKFEARGKKLGHEIFDFLFLK